MKLKSFGISNFKAFGASLQRMPLKPITLIFGPNSAGKSSLLQSFLWSLRATESGKISGPTPETSAGTVDLGSFRSLLHRNDSDRRIEVEITLETAPGSEPVRIVHQLGVPSQAEISRMHVTWTNESEPTRKYDELSYAARDARQIINGLFLGDPPSLEEVEAIVGNDEALDQQIQTMRESYLDGVFDWINGGDLSPELIRQTMEKGRTAWAEFRKLRPYATEIHQHRERVNARITAERNKIGLLAVEILCGSETAMKAARIPGKQSLQCQIIDPDVINKMVPADPDWLDSMVQPTFSPTAPTLFKGYELDVAALQGVTELPREALENVFAWLRAARIQYGFIQDQLVYLGPLRHLPTRKELMGSPGEVPSDESLAPWIRLRDETPIRTKVNKLLKRLNSQPCEFDVRHTAAPADALRAASGFDVIMATKTDINNPDWIDGESQSFGSSEEWPSFEEMRDEDEVAAFEKLNASLLDDPSADVLVDLGIRDNRHGVRVSIRDVGTGISQIAPILVHAVAEEDKTIAIEQPEIHIHPALQAELADVFIESALGENTNTFLLETHSEHLILRLLRRIRETTNGKLNEWPEALKQACPNGIRPEDIAVLYVEPGEEGSTIKELPVTTDGDFSQPWPSGFFTERDRELF